MSTTSYGTRTGDNPGESNFRSDLVINGRVNRLMDKLYKDNGIKFIRENDLDKQFQGIDGYIIAKDGHKIVVDEKAATDGWDPAKKMYNSFDMLPTFSMEIAYRKNGEIKCGWACNQDLATEIYAFVYLQSNDDYRTATAMEVIFVEKKTITEKLKSIGIESYKDGINLINEDGGAKVKYDKKGRPYRCIDGITLKVSKQKNEKPLNALFGRDFLRRVAVRKLCWQGAVIQKAA